MSHFSPLLGVVQSTCAASGVSYLQHSQHSTNTGTVPAWQSAESWIPSPYPTAAACCSCPWGTVQHSCMFCTPREVRATATLSLGRHGEPTLEHLGRTTCTLCSAAPTQPTPGMVCVLLLTAFMLLSVG